MFVQFSLFSSVQLSEVALLSVGRVGSVFIDCLNDVLRRTIVLDCIIDQ